MTSRNFASSKVRAFEGVGSESTSPFQFKIEATGPFIVKAVSRARDPSRCVLAWEAQTTYFRITT
jgi:hypothetical protein